MKAYNYGYHVLALGLVLLTAIIIASASPNIQLPQLPQPTFPPKNAKLKGVNYPSWYKLGSSQVPVMRQWGVNVVRLIVFPESNPNFNMLDETVEACLANGMVVIINAHYFSDPGYHTDLTKWDSAKFDRWLNYLATVTARYPQKNVWINILNEPYTRTAEDYVRIMRMGIDKVRSVNPSKTVVVDGACGPGVGGWHMLIEETHPLERDNVVFAPHYYYDSDSQGYTREAIIAHFNKQGWTWALEHGRTLLLEEFNFHRNTVNGATWLRNLLGLLREQGWLGYTVWDWRPLETWDAYNVVSDDKGTPTLSGQIIMEDLKAGG